MEESNGRGPVSDFSKRWKAVVCMLAIQKATFDVFAARETSYWHPKGLSFKELLALMLKHLRKYLAASSFISELDRLR